MKNIRSNNSHSPDNTFTIGNFKFYLFIYGRHSIWKSIKMKLKYININRNSMISNAITYIVIHSNIDAIGLYVRSMNDFVFMVRGTWKTHKIVVQRIDIEWWNRNRCHAFDRFAIEAVRMTLFIVVFLMWPSIKSNLIYFGFGDVESSIA